MFASLPGVSAPPPFGGNQRTIVVRVDPDRLRSYPMSPDEVINAITQGNSISPSGNIRIGDKMAIVPINSLVRQVKDLETIPIRPGQDPSVYVRDVATVLDASDIPRATLWPTAVALSISWSPSGPTPRRCRSSTTSGRPCRACRRCCRTTSRLASSLTSRQPSPIHVDLVAEGLMGAGLTGLMVLLFLRDWRSVIVVVLNIPFALCGAVVALWLTGQTINLMTLGGLALAVGILVDESTVEVENIHHQMEGTPRSPRRSGSGNHKRRSHDCWRCFACWPYSSRRSSCRGPPGRFSSRCRWPSDSRWSRRTCFPARSCRFFRPGCSATTIAWSRARQSGYGF